MKTTITGLIALFPITAGATGAGPPDLGDGFGLFIGILFCCLVFSVPIAYALLVRFKVSKNKPLRYFLYSFPFLTILISVSSNALITAGTLFLSFVFFVVFPALVVELLFVWKIKKHNKSNQSGTSQSSASV